ncbi:MAG: DUF4364 family protein [Lachnospiraceae bacterium]|nr:DUF4364 family protein [Lachnospiraceae bacterium]
MLDLIDFAITNSQITDFMLEYDYANYFEVQQSLSELVDLNFLSLELLKNNARYTITEDGKNVLSLLDYKITSKIKQNVYNYLKENKYALKDKNSIVAYYFASENSSDYTVSLQIKENKSNMFEINLLVPDEEIASKICSNWQKENEDVYEYIIKKLIQK